MRSSCNANTDTSLGTHGPAFTHGLRWRAKCADRVAPACYHGMRLAGQTQEGRDALYRAYGRIGCAFHCESKCFTEPVQRVQCAAARKRSATRRKAFANIKPAHAGDASDTDSCCSSSSATKLMNRWVLEKAMREGFWQLMHPRKCENQAQPP